MIVLEKPVARLAQLGLAALIVNLEDVVALCSYVGFVLMSPYLLFELLVDELHFELVA